MVASWLKRLCWLGWLGAAGLAVAADGDLTTFDLENGIRVVVKEDHRSPTVMHMVWYVAGSIDEKNGHTGLAHVLEHMMFKGTENLKPGEFSEKVAALGGRDNAFTSRDYTAYFQLLQAKHLPTVMALETERMGTLNLTQDEFVKEIEVVKEERRWRTDDRSSGKLYEAFMAIAFQANPIRNPVIGWMSDLEHMTVHDLQKWYNDWYTPQNAKVIIVGDVNPDEVKKWAKTTYATLTPTYLPERKPQTEPKQEGVRRVQVKAAAENPYVIMGFKVPKLVDVEKDVDPYALSVLAGVLDGYSGARLGRELVHGKQLASQAGASYSGISRGPTLFYLDATPRPGQTVESLEAALLEQVDRIAKQGITEPELRRVKAQLVASEVYKRDSIYGQAMELGQFITRGFQPAHIDRVIWKLKQVTAEQVQDVARRYFSPDQMTVGTLYPLPLDKAAKQERPARAHEY